MFYHHHHIVYVQHLAVLGLCEGATFSDVRSSYRALAMQWHPDRFGTRPGRRAEAEERMKRINAAYEWLTLNAYMFEVDWSEVENPSTEPNVTTEEPVRPAYRQEEKPERKFGCVPLICFWVGGSVISRIEWNSTSESILFVLSVLVMIGIVVALLRKPTDKS